VLLIVLTHKEARQLFGSDWTQSAKTMVAQFRATHDIWADDPAFRDLLQRLKQGCAEFSTWWKVHDVRGTAAGVKQLHHPKSGLLRFEHASFQLSDDPALRLVIYTPK
jgi:MmyB-like transcription regulator ligand binding domain